jgi:DNA-binding response OmpR family regulator
MSAILLVEHDAAVRGALADLLTAQGHHVASVAMPEEALSRLADAELLLLDMDGPTESAFAALDQARATRPDIAVVATASATLHGWKTLITAMRLGADDFLTKPFEDDELSLALRGALARNAPAASTAAA